jgi:pyruvate dehydrogenase E1 component alpha subunit
MHLADLGRGMLGANGIVPDGLTIAAGAAHALKLRGGEGVVVSFFGDGGVNRGPFLEALNWAAAFGLRVLFVCEDNAFASTTRSRLLTAGPGPAARAEALGVAAEEVDGNDVLAVAEVAARLLAEVRAGAGPRFLHARTYRLKGHTANDAGAYRSPEEVAEAQRDDPLRRAEGLLAAGGADWQGVRSAATVEMSAVLELAASTPFPADASAFADVQDAGAPVA